MSSAASFRCPSCSATLKYNPALAGKAIKCPKCGTTLRIPEAPKPEPEPEPEFVPTPAEDADEGELPDPDLAPPPRTAKKPKKKSGPANLLLLIGGGAAVLLVVLGVGVYFVVSALLSSDSPPKGPGPQAKKGDPVQGQPPPFGEPAPGPKAMEFLAGKWESVDEKDRSLMEFHKDGTVVMSSPLAGEARGTYKLVGDNTLEVVAQLGAETVKQNLTLTKLTADELVTTDEASKVERFRRSTGEAVAAKPAEAGPTKAGGHPTPEAALDAYAKAVQDLDVPAFKALLARAPGRLEGFNAYVQQEVKDKPAGATEAAWKDLVKSLRDSEWAPGRFRRFPAEVEGDKAFVVALTRDPAGKDERARKYTFAKVGGGWHQTAAEVVAAKDLDPTKYAWDKGTGGAAPAGGAGLGERFAIKSHTKEVRCVTFSTDGKLVATAGDDGAVKVWDAGAGKEVKALPGHKDQAAAVAFSADGKLLASAGSDFKVVLWELATGKPKATFEGYDVVAITPDGKTLAAQSFNGTVKVFDVTSNAERHTLKSRDIFLYCLAFTNDGKLLAGGNGNGTVVVWDVLTGKERHALTGHTQLVRALQFSADGSTLATVSVDNTAKLWDVSAGKEKASFKDFTYPVNHAAVSYDAKTVASEGPGHVAALWDVGSGKAGPALTGHVSALTALAFSPDGKTFAAGAVDGTLRVWALVPDAPAPKAEVKKPEVKKPEEKKPEEKKPEEKKPDLKKPEVKKPAADPRKDDKKANPAPPKKDEKKQAALDAIPGRPVTSPAGGRDLTVIAMRLPTRRPLS